MKRKTRQTDKQEEEDKLKVRKPKQKPSSSVTKVFELPEKTFNFAYCGPS
jgi:hypothetical protein